MKLQLKRSNVIELGAAKEPTAEQMEYGELAVNYSGDDPAVFIKDSNDQIIRIAGAGNISSGDTPAGPDLPSTGNDVGDLFFDTVNNTLNYWNGAEWVPIEANKNENIFVGTEAEADFYLSPASRPEGFLWWNVDDETLYVWYDNSGSPEWRPATPVSDAGGGASVTIDDTPPATGDTEPGDLWWDSTDGRLYIYYEDASSAQWVDASPKSDGISDAPADGNQYARKDNSWSVVTNTGGGSGGGSGDGDTNINYSGAAAWGDVAGDGTLLGGLNVSTSLSGTTYTVTFPTPMPDANYAVTFSGEVYPYVNPGSKTANGFSYLMTDGNSGGFTSPSSFAVHALNALPPKGGTGTDAWGSVQENGTLDASFNVASVTRTSAGKYAVVFTTPMPTANYAVNATQSKVDTTTVSVSDETANGFNVTIAGTSTGTPRDTPFSFTVNATNATLPQTITQEQIDAAINNPGAAAWGYSETATDTLLSGNNIASIKYDAALAGWKVTFSTPMPNANYAVFVTGNYTNGYEATIDNTSKTPTSFLAKFYNVGQIAAPPYINVVVFATNALPPKGGTGTDSWGSVQADGTLDASFNVASVTRTAEGKYAVVFTTPMPTDKYAVTGSCNDSTDINMSFVVIETLVSGFTYTTIRDNQAGIDLPASFTVNATNATLPQTVTQEQIDAAINNPGASAWGYVATDGTLKGGLNVSTKLGALGAYVVTFTTPMPDANYSIVFGAEGFPAYINGTKTATGFEYYAYNASGTGYTTYETSFAVFATNALPPKGGTGTDAWGHIDENGALSASFNCTCVKTGTSGERQITFVTPMPTANYSITTGSAGEFSSASAFDNVSTYNLTTTGFTIRSKKGSSFNDTIPISFAVNATNATLPTSFTEEEIQSVLDFIKTGGNAPVALLQDIQPTLTSEANGGAGWNPRVFNTEDDVFNLVSLDPSGEEFTLQPGAYLIDWFATSLQAGQIKSRLTNVTTGSTEGLGSTNYSNAGADYASVQSTGTARIQIATATTFKIEQYSYSNSTYGFGIGNAGDGPNLYAQVKIQGTPSTVTTTGIQLVSDQEFNTRIAELEAAVARIQSLEATVQTLQADHTTLMNNNNNNNGGY